MGKCTSTFKMPKANKEIAFCPKEVARDSGNLGKTSVVSCVNGTSFVTNNETGIDSGVAFRKQENKTENNKFKIDKVVVKEENFNQSNIVSIDKDNLKNSFLHKIASHQSKSFQLKNSSSGGKKELLVNSVDIRTIYQFESEKLGEGSFGKVRAATRIDNPEKHFAIKSMKKKRIYDQKLLETELEILSSLDHPNIIKFIEFYEDSQHFHIVMEICRGLELFDEVQKSKSFNEKKTMEVVFKIVNAIYYSHTEGIIHRDLKLENIMFESLEPNAQIKIIDWGLSAKFERDSDFLSTVAGTPQFVAPEVFKGEYDYKCDIWAIGVITYVILAWKYPFKGTSVKNYLLSLAQDEVTFDYPEFNNVSTTCKDFIINCIQKDPDKRFDIKQCFEHPWFKDQKQKQQSMELDSKVLHNIRTYAAPSNKLQAFIRDHFIHLLLLPKDINELRDHFQAMDIDGTGFINLSELTEAFRRSNIEVDEGEIREIFRNAKNTLKNERNDNLISYSEFLLAATDQSQLIKRENLIRVFNYFDEDNTGYIDIHNLRSLLLRTMKSDSLITDQEFEEIVKEVVSCSGKIIKLKDFLTFFSIEGTSSP